MSRLQYLLIVVLLIFCSPLAAENNPELEQVTLQLKWFHQFQFAGYYAAKEQGFYADEGLEVEIRPLSSNTDRNYVKAVLNGEAEYGVGDLDLLQYFLQGQPIRALAAIFQHSPLVLLARQDSGIISPYELIGKRLMYDPYLDGSTITAMLHQAGLTETDYQRLPNSFDYQNLIDGTVDAMAGYVTDQPFFFKKQQVPINIIAPTSYGIDFYSDLLFTSQQEIDQHPDRAERMRRASLKGWAYALEHPEEIIDLILEKYPDQHHDRERLQFEARETRKLILPNLIPLGEIRLERLYQAAKIYQKLGYVYDGYVYDKESIREFIFEDLPATTNQSDGIDQNMRQVADYVAKIASIPIWELNLKLLNNALDPFFVNRRIKAIKISDLVLNQPVFVIFRQDQDLIKLTQSSFPEDLNLQPFQHVSQSVFYSEKQIGSVIVYYDNTEDISQTNQKEQLALTPEEQNFLSQHSVIRVATSMDSAPLSFNDNGQATGFNIDYLNLLGKVLRIRFDYMMSPSITTQLSMLKERKVDMIAALAYLKEREDFVLYSKPYFSLHTGLATTKANQKITSLQTLNGKILAINKDYYQRKILEQEYPGIKLMPVYGTSEGLESVMSGNADAMLDVLPTLDYYIRDYFFTNLVTKPIFDNPYFAQNSGYMGVRKDWVSFTHLLNKAMDVLDPLEISEVKEKWINTTLTTAREIQLTTAEKNWLANKQTIKICVLPSYLPYEGIDEHGNHVGMAADLMRIIEQRLETPLELYPTKTWNESHQAIKQGLCDMLPAAQDLEYRRSYLDFTQPYIESTTVVATRLDEMFVDSLEQIKDHRLGVVEKYAYAELIRNDYPDIDIVPVASLSEGIDQVRRGELFGMIDALGSLAYELQKQGALDIKIAGKIGYDLDLSMAIRKDEPILLSIMSKAIDNFTSDEIQRILNKWIAIKYEAKTDYRLFWRVLVIGGVIFLATLFWNRLLMRQIWLRKQAEKELVAARQRALDASRAKSEFLANMSHEIRTPMNAILGMAYLALKRQPEPQLRDYLNKIHTAGLALLGIINDILDFSKIEAGKLDIENTHFELSATLSHITNLFSQKITEKGIVLVYDLDPDIPDNLLGDPLRLNQILINLINNAIKFTENGKIRLTSRIEKQTDQHVRIRFSVQDSGIGMTPEQQKRLFQAFSQADSSTTRKYGGTGLGLTICKRLVDLMGGEISVESVAGQGSTFSFTVNLGLSQQPRKQVPTEFSRLKALVVDDGEEAREILKNRLQELSITADAAASGSEALAMLRAGSGQRSYDVVLLDWRMAGMDGLVTAQEIRQDSRIVQQPAIVIVSSYCLGTLQQEFSSLDIQGFLAKPVNPSMLFNLLAQLFAREVRESCPDSDSAIVNQSLAGAKLLLVEDNEINQQIAMELLTGAGGEVQIAANGREAVSRLVEQQETYDIVLMDLQMPEMDGYQATATILQDKRFARLPVIAMTAHAIKEERQRCFDAGMVDYITKPIEPRVMFETIVRWLPEHLKRQDKVNNRATTASVTPESATELPDFAGVDLADGLRRIGGNTALYRRLLQGFAQRYGHQADDIEQAIAQGERDSAGKIVHALKGVSANLGAYDLTNQAVALEQALKNGAEPAELRPVLTALKSTLETLVAAIQHGLQTSAELSATPDNRQNSPVDQQHHSALFSELLRLVEQADGDTLEFVTEHQATLKTWFTEDAWQKFHNDLIAYDFISAQSQLQQIGNHDIKPGIAR